MSSQDGHFPDPKGSEQHEHLVGVVRTSQAIIGYIRVD